MQQKSILFLGFGDLADRAAKRLVNCRRIGVARSNKPVPAGVTLWQGSVDEPDMLARIGREAWDAVVITFSPAEFTDDAYRRTYVETLQALLPVWQAAPPGLVLMASSTGVYAQADGSWVDETSPAEPQSFSGQRLMQAEAHVAQSGLPHCIVRFAGIYGPGRDHLLRQVRAGQGGAADYTNRIHAEDCAAIIEHLVQRHFDGLPLAPVYLACDSEPAPGNEVRAWLAMQMGLDPDRLEPGTSARAGSKRCSNKRLLQSGYRLLYPSYREGYRELLAQS